ncbi:MFS transporter [Paenibacillus aurantius]|uniref:MFS transporter n=1 Tax=Paenibacillus aurantius TaxID=2918900 RepID=A0AA96L9U3_9BACL|nr:MFS transporter [Paenibacillus aurantius]WNQ09789.1 MFS transporter [Paenibacillus aurantius]
MNRIRRFLHSYHPVVHILLIGTVLARTASTMSMPFLALYLAAHTEASAVLIGFVIGAGSLAGTVGGFIGGTLSDKLGRKGVMLAALFGWAVVFIGFALVREPVLFLVLNLLNGLCKSFYEPVSQALMADLTEPSKRYKVFSLRYMSINIGGAVGPLAGAYFGTVNGSLPFFLTGLVYLLYALILFVLLARFGIRKIEGNAKAPVSFQSAWNVIRRDGPFRLYIAGGILGAMGYSQMTVTLSQYLRNSVAHGVELFGWLMTVNALVVIVLQLPLSSWAAKRTPLAAIVTGNVLFALGIVGFSLSSGAVGFIAAMVVFTLGEILTYPAGNLLVDKLAPEGMRGTYFGAQTFTNIGHFVGPLAGGYLLSHYGGSPLFLTMAAVTLGGSYFYAAGSRLAAPVRQAPPAVQEKSA